LNNDKFDGIFNVAGGWAGGNASSIGKRIRMENKIIKNK
jgi:hypothetical protein